MSRDGSQLMLVGSFTRVGSEGFGGVALLLGDSWQRLGQENGNGVTGRVTDIEVVGDDEFVSGYFSHLGGRLVNNIARWDGSEWHALGVGEPGVSPSGVINDMLFADGKLFVTGRFERAGNSAAQNIAAWAGGQWQALQGPTRNGVPFEGAKLASISGDLYVAGSDNFTNSGSSFAKWSNARWELMPQFELGTMLSAIGSFDNQPVTGGSRVTYRWDDDQWVQMYQSFSNSILIALGNWRGRLLQYFYGAFGSSGDELVYFDGNGFSPLIGAPRGFIHELTEFKNGLMVAGSFDSTGQQIGNGIARFDGQSWSGVWGLNRNPSVNALAQQGDFLYVGGDIHTVGGQLSSGIGRVRYQPDDILIDRFE
jgi:hypothetical protein